MITKELYPKHKKIFVHDLRYEMILARNVIKKNGLILIPSGTTINTNCYELLVKNGIRYVYVKISSIDEKNPHIESVSHDESNISSSIVDRAEFQAFKKSYTKITEQLKNCLKSISNGSVINLQELYQLTDGIMGKLKCKNDVFAYISFLKSSDEHTYAHSNNVSLLCNLFSQWIPLSQEEILNLTTAGILHDIGKTRIPQKILNKTGRLTNEEFKIMKNHTIYGYKMINEQNIPDEIKLSALLHHEKSDGSGYPFGVKGDEIPKLVKIVAICDIYDAMTTNRVYRNKLCPFDVIRTFETQSYGALDTELLLVFLKNIAYTYLGSMVKLSNGFEGEVVFINSSNLSKPMVRVNNDIIDLSDVSDIKIESLI